MVKVWYIDSWGQETMEYINIKKLRREPTLAMRGTVHRIHKNYVELRLESGRIISVHYDYLERLERLL